MNIKAAVEKSLETNLITADVTINQGDKKVLDEAHKKKSFY